MRRLHAESPPAQCDDSNEQVLKRAKEILCREIHVCRMTYSTAAARAKASRRSAPADVSTASDVASTPGPATVAPTVAAGAAVSVPGPSSTTAAAAVAATAASMSSWLESCEGAFECFGPVQSLSSLPPLSYSESVSDTEQYYDDVDGPDARGSAITCASSVTATATAGGSASCHVPVAIVPGVGVESGACVPGLPSAAVDSDGSVGHDDGYAAGDEKPGAAALGLVPTYITTTRVDHATGFLGLSRGSCVEASHRQPARSKTTEDAHRRKVLFGSDHILP